MKPSLQDVTQILVDFSVSVASERLSTDLCRFVPFSGKKGEVYSSDLCFFLSKRTRLSPQELGEKFLATVPHSLLSLVTTENGYIHVDADQVHAELHEFRPSFHQDTKRVAVSLKGSSPGSWEVVRLSAMGLVVGVLRALYGLKTSLSVGDLTHDISPGCPIEPLRFFQSALDLSENSDNTELRDNSRVVVGIRGEERAGSGRFIVTVPKQNVVTPTHLQDVQRWLSDYSGNLGSLVVCLALSVVDGALDPEVPYFEERANLPWWFSMLYRRLTLRANASSTQVDLSLSEEDFMRVARCEAFVRWSVFRDDPASALQHLRALADHLARLVFPSHENTSSTQKMVNFNKVEELLTRYQHLRAPLEGGWCV